MVDRLMCSLRTAGLMGGFRSASTAVTRPSVRAIVGTRDAVSLAQARGRERPPAVGLPERPEAALPRGRDAQPAVVSVSYFRDLL